MVTAATASDGDAFDVVRLVRETSPDTTVVVFADDPRSLESLRESDLVVEFLSRSIPNARDLLMASLVGSSGEGTLLVAADVSATEALDDFERAGGSVDSECVSVIDCAYDDNQGLDDHVCGVTSPADLTGIGMEFSSLYEDLYADGYHMVRTGIYTLAPLLLYVDDVRAVFRFLHTVTGRIRSVGGLGVCAIDPGAQDDRTVKSVGQAFDGRIDLRVSDTDGCEIRIRGLPDQTDGWQQFNPIRAVE